MSDANPSETIAAELREGSAPPTIAAVMIAWVLTLGPSGFGRGSSLLASATSVLALLAGLAGPLIARRYVRLGRHVGITLFAGFSTATWVMDSYAIHPFRLDPVRGVLGGIAWGVFALAWSERWSSRSAVMPADPDAPILLPRAALQPLAAPITAVGVLFALVYLWLAFQVRDPERALVTQAAALACGVGVVVASGIVSTARGKPRTTSSRRLTPTVVRALLLLVTTAVMGAVITALR